MRGRQADACFITEQDPAPGTVRLAVKDLFDTAGVRTTYGSAIFAEHVPTTTAPAVARLEAAGFGSVGKANLHEFAWGITSQNPHFGHVGNPLDATRIPGGSSGGCAAALAAGVADAALGTDSGGSIRIPSACCGTTGLKPTHGRVPLDGCFPLAPSFDHAGPMARDVAGCERQLAALDPGFSPHPAVSLADLRIGLAWVADADPLVRARVAAAAARFGHVEDVDLPFPDGTYAAFQREAAIVHAALISAQRAGYSDNVAHKIELALTITDAQDAVARAACTAYRDAVADLLAPFDLLVTPTLETVAPPAAGGEAPLRPRILRLTYPFNVTGAPALALPCGPAEHGLPASVQLVGPTGADALVLAAGRALETVVATALQR